MRVAIYARVSTRDQSTAGQVDQLRDYCTRQGWEVTEYADTGVSGAKAKRPALDLALAAVHRREVDALVCTKLDRLGRSVAHLCEIAAKLRAAGVRLVVLDQAIDTETATGELLFHVLGAVAQFERELIRERVSAGLDRARRRGTKLGRPARLDRRGRDRVQRLRASGRSLREIATRLGIGVGTVRRALA